LMPVYLNEFDLMFVQLLAELLSVGRLECRLR
jgi:hypothetical protein